MGDATLDAFRRWVQLEISEIESLPEGLDRSKRLQHLEAALQEAIAFETAWNQRVDADVEPVEEQSSVRLVSAPMEDNEVRNVNIKQCQNCDSELNDDLEFCPSCGEFQ